MPVTVGTYQQVALEDPEGHWELIGGHLRQKPGMTAIHDYTGDSLGRTIADQLDKNVLNVRINNARLRVGTGSFRIPDVTVLPMATIRRRLKAASPELDVYAEPVLFVAEVWSPSTGGYDFEVKLAQYRERGDAEIWFVQPYDRAVTIWRRQPDGSYVESYHAGGTLAVGSLPGVSIDLGRLFDW